MSKSPRHKPGASPTLRTGASTRAHDSRLAMDDSSSLPTSPFLDSFRIADHLDVLCCADQCKRVNEDLNKLSAFTREIGA